MHIIHNVCNRRVVPSYSTFAEADRNILWPKQKVSSKGCKPLWRPLVKLQQWFINIKIACSVFEICGISEYEVGEDFVVDVEHLLIVGFKFLQLECSLLLFLERQHLEMFEEIDFSPM